MATANRFKRISAEWPTPFYLGKASKERLAEIRKIYEEGGPEIFKKKQIHRHFTEPIPNTYDAPYSNTTLGKYIREFIGERTKLGDISGRVLITAFDMDSCSGDEDKFHTDCEETHRSWRPHHFTNALSDQTPDERERLAWKVGMATSAVPGFLPIFEGFVDGSIFVSNPSMTALGFTQNEGLIIN